jgi:hypothetical protein
MEVESGNVTTLNQGDLNMADINFEAKTDRELLIIVAHAVNSLKEKTDILWIQAMENKKHIEADAERINLQEYKLHELILKEIDCARETSKTLEKINILLGLHTEKLSTMDNMKRLFWWLIAALGAVMITLMGLLIRHVID